MSDTKEQFIIIRSDAWIKYMTRDDLIKYALDLTHYIVNKHNKKKEINHE